jgi:hypothetical protein
MKFNKELLKCLKGVVLKDFQKHTTDLGGVCIIGASLKVFNTDKNKYTHFIHQLDVCEAQGETAIIKAFQEAEKITNQLFPSLQTQIAYGNLD